MYRHMYKHMSIHMKKHMSQRQVVGFELWDKDVLSSDEFMGEVRLGTVSQLLSAHGAALTDGGVASIVQQVGAREGTDDKPAQGDLFVDLHVTEELQQLSGALYTCLRTCLPPSSAPVCMALCLSSTADRGHEEASSILVLL